MCMLSVGLVTLPGSCLCLALVSSRRSLSWYSHLRNRLGSSSLVSFGAGRLYVCVVHGIDDLTSRRELLGVVSGDAQIS